jgi:hypothetical protein
MELEHYLFLATTAFVSALPAVILARAPAMRDKSIWAKLYVFVAAAVCHCRSLSF